MYTQLNPLNRIQREPFSLGAAAIAGGASILGSGANAYAQGKMNKATRKWNEKMYSQQKADNLDFWNMQNSYNSPQAQMARFQEAGLNPNLMYGQGSDGAASSMSAPNPIAYKPNAPDLSPGNVVGGYYDTQLKQATLDNVKKQGDLMVLDGVTKALQNSRFGKENQFLDEFLQGRNYKQNQEGSLLSERATGQALLNMFQGGIDSPLLGAGAGIQKGSAYDLQAKGLDLTNRLRSSELRGKQQNFDIGEIRRKYTERMMSGKLSDMGAKDILTLILQGASMFK